MSIKKALINGEVITVNENNEVVEAVVIYNNKIVYVGKTEEALKYVDSDTKVIDLQGKAVVPGFIDCHIHMAVSGIDQSNSLILSKDKGINSISDILDRIKEIAKNSKEGEWISGSSYNPEDLVEKRHPNRWEIDEVAPNNPVNLSHTSGHISVSNTKALELGHMFDGKESYPEVDVYIDENGQPTGVLKESAHFKMMKFIPLEPSDTLIIEGIERLGNKLSEFGITTTHDAGGFGTSTFRTLQKAKEESKLKNRSYPMLWSMYGKDAQVENIETQIKSGFYTGLGDEYLKMGPIKIMLDGSSVGGTCATREPISSIGKSMPLTFTEDEIDEIVLKAHKNYFQITAHAIGDRAIEVLLNAFEKAQKLYPRNDCRHRIEHCMICQPDLIKRIKDLGVIPIPNPGFISVWGSIYTKFYGERCDYVFPIGDYIKEGIPCAFGSDAMALADFRPLLGIASAVERMDLATNEVIGVNQKIGLLDAIRCYTYNGAYASFDENIKGSLEVNKLADIVILSDSILDKSPEEIRNMFVDKTIFDGEIIYESGSM